MYMYVYIYTRIYIYIYHMGCKLNVKQNLNTYKSVPLWANMWLSFTSFRATPRRSLPPRRRSVCPALRRWGDSDVRAFDSMACGRLLVEYWRPLDDTPWLMYRGLSRLSGGADHFWRATSTHRTGLSIWGQGYITWLPLSWWFDW